MMRKHKTTDEEKVAIKLGNILSDLRIDIEQAGVYFARSERLVSQNRLQIIAESAKAERENIDYGINQYTLF